MFSAYVISVAPHGASWPLALGLIRPIFDAGTQSRPNVFADGHPGIGAGALHRLHKFRRYQQRQTMMRLIAAFHTYVLPQTTTQLQPNQFTGRRTWKRQAGDAAPGAARTGLRWGQELRWRHRMGEGRRPMVGSA